MARLKGCVYGILEFTVFRVLGLQLTVFWSLRALGFRVFRAS